MGRMPYIDQSGLYVMEDAIMDLVNDNKKVLMVDVLQQPEYMLERIDIIPDLISKDYIFKTFDDCTSWIIEQQKK